MKKLFLIPVFLGFVFTTSVLAQTDMPTSQVQTTQLTASSEQPGLSTANDRGFILGIGGASFGYEFLNSLFLYGVSGDLGYRFSPDWAVLLFAEILFTRESGETVVVANLIPQVKFNFDKHWYVVAGSGLLTVTDGIFGDNVGIGVTAEASGGYDFYFGKNKNWLVSPKLGVNYSYLADDNIGNLNFKHNYVAPVAHVTVSYQF